MAGLDQLVMRYESDVFPLLSLKSQDFIESDRLAVDYWMEIDDYLQFSLLEGAQITDELLELTETEVLFDWDEQLKDRTIGWIEKHRERNSSR